MVIRNLIKSMKSMYSRTSSQFKSQIPRIHLKQYSVCICYINSIIDRGKPDYKEYSKNIKHPNIKANYNNTVSVLWWEEGYTMKYSLRTRENIRTLFEKAEEVSWWMLCVGRSQGQNQRGRRPQGFWPRDLLRHNIHHDTSKVFS